MTALAEARLNFLKRVPWVVTWEEHGQKTCLRVHTEKTAGDICASHNRRMVQAGRFDNWAHVERRDQ